MKRIFVNDDVYHFSVVGIYGGTLQEAINWYAAKNKVEAWEAPNGNLVGHFGARRPLRTSVMWFRDKSPSMTTVAHECFHATMYLFEILSMKGPVDETEEVFAYYLEWLMNNFYRGKK